MDAAVAVRLLEPRSSGRWGLGPLGGPLVGNAALKAMVEHHAALYADLRDPVALLRDEGAGSAMSAYWPYAAYPDGAMPPERVAEYSALMTASQPMVIDEVLDAWDFSRHRRVLDVGGGEGRFVAALAQRCPRLALMLFDLPQVAALARQRLAGLGLAQRVQAHGGSFFDDPLPQGADLVTLVRVLFDHDDAHALAAACSSPSRWRRRRGRTPWATRTSASTCWPWAAASPARRRTCASCWPPRVSSPRAA